MTTSLLNAGFMRIEELKSLDNTGVHPESYDVCKNMLEMLGYSLSDVENKIYQI